MSISTRIKGAREHKGLTRTDLAMLLGVTQKEVISLAEHSHLRKYRTLDEHGKKIVDMVLCDDTGIFAPPKSVQMQSMSNKYSTKKRESV